MAFKRLGRCFGASVLALGAAQIAHGQTTAPSSVTPPTLRPEPTTGGVQVAIPDSGALVAPRGSEALTVTLVSATVEGGFREVAGETNAIIATLQGRRVTLAEIYKAASGIEEAHARAGYVLARVVVPPQSLVDGGALRLIVIDGFIDEIDLSQVPARARGTVARRVAGLKGRHHVRLIDIERPLLIADDVPGLTLSSTLTRGAAAGGVRLVLVGRQALISGSIGADNSLSPALDRYEVTAQLALNSALGLGEQIYGFASSGYNVSKLFSSDVPVRVLGGGVVMPFGDGRLTLNPEATFSRTQPKVTPGTPQSRGSLRRLTLRSNYTLIKTRAQNASLALTLEQIDETNALPQFGVDISHDRFMAARLGVTYGTARLAGVSLVANAQLSQGLGGLGGLKLSELPSGTTYSRQGASHQFTKLDLTVRAVAPLASEWRINATVKAQTTFGRPVFRSEQTALEGSDALSAYVGGLTAVDEAVTGRAELSKPVSLPHLQLVPYAFAAGGLGRIDQPTVLEPGSIAAASVGAGLRAAIAGTGLTLSVEYAHGFADYAPLRSADRVNAALSLHF
jgi:hemolysin activation/secretion protein